MVRSKRRETDPPVVSSLRVLHRLEHTEIHREEKEGGRRQGWSSVEKGESKEERAVRPVISLPSKNGY